MPLPHIPLLLPSVLLIASVLIGRALPVDVWLMAGLVSTVLPAVWMLRRRAFYASAVVLSMCCAGYALGATHPEVRGRGHVVRVPQEYTWHRARIEGRVLHVALKGTNRLVLRVDGHHDCNDAACAITRSVVTWFVPSGYRAHLPAEGCFVVMDAKVRLPRHPTLPGEFDEVRLAQSTECPLVATCQKLTITHEAPWWTTLILNVRQSLQRRLAQGLPSDVVGIATAILLGDRSGIERDDMHAYSLSGTAHMFSVSGSHVAVIVAMLALLTGASQRWYAVMLRCIALWCYIVLVGGEPPAMRAGIMGTLALVGIALQRDVLPLNLLCASVILMIAMNPTIVTDVSFVLSLSATVSLLVLVPRLSETLTKLFGSSRRGWISRSLIAAFSVNIAATIGVALPSVVVFDSIALMGPAANLIVVPLLSIALITSAVVLLPFGPYFVAPWVWWSSLLIRTADAVAKGAALGALDSVPLINRCAIMALLCSALLWPLFAERPRNLIRRTMIGVCALIALRLMYQPAPLPTSIVSVREHGLVLAHNGRLVVVGHKNAPRDAAVIRWARASGPWKHIEGRGLWGRKMAGAIQHPDVSSDRSMGRWYQ